MEENIKLIVPEYTIEHSYLNNPDVNYSKALMLHAQQQHLKFRASSACIATYPMCAPISWGQSLQHSSWCSHTSFVPQCPTLLQTPTWLCALAMLSLEYISLVSAPSTHIHFERSSPPPDLLLWCNPSTPELENNTANPTTLENKSPVPDGSSFSWQKYGTFNINWDRRDFKTRLF